MRLTQRAYLLFRTMGLRHMYVTDSANQPIGVLTRKDLMDYRLHEVLHPHCHGGGADHGGLHIEPRSGAASWQRPAPGWNTSGEVMFNHEMATLPTVLADSSNANV